MWGLRFSQSPTALVLSHSQPKEEPLTDILSNVRVWADPKTHEAHHRLEVIPAPSAIQWKRALQSWPSSHDILPGCILA